MNGFLCTEILTHQQCLLKQEPIKCEVYIRENEDSEKVGKMTLNNSTISPFEEMNLKQERKYDWRIKGGANLPEKSFNVFFFLSRGM